MESIERKTEDTEKFDFETPKKAKISTQTRK